MGRGHAADEKEGTKNGQRIDTAKSELNYCRLATD